MIQAEKVEKVARLVDLNPSQVEQILFGETEILNKIKQASTIEEAKEAYNATPSGSEAEKLALEKWNSLALNKAQQASTIEEAKEAYNTAPVGSEAGKLALEKLYQLV